MDEQPGSKNTFLSWLPVIVLGITGAISVGVLQGKSSTHDKQINDNVTEISKIDRLVDKAVVDIAVVKAVNDERAEFQKERTEWATKLAEANAKIEYLEHKK